MQKIVKRWKFVVAGILLLALGFCLGFTKSEDKGKASSFGMWTKNDIKFNESTWVGTCQAIYMPYTKASIIDTKNKFKVMVSFDGEMSIIRLENLGEGSEKHQALVRAYEFLIFETYDDYSYYVLGGQQ